MNRKIKAQEAYVKQLEDALKHYVATKASPGIIRTAQDYVYVETGKLNNLKAAA
jgi:hypothetical protein